ncbi:MAG TPA: hypothetical protein VFR58_13660 [Flavisolibacter sp.]|nr:hypothetical protein [Flavisolibacter sp.]
MKQPMPFFVLLLLLTACGNDKSEGNSGPGMTNIQNVNGNMPDTSSSINLDNGPAQDSSSFDSTPPKPGS